MTIYNWKFIKTPNGATSACLCNGDKLHREFTDFNLAFMFEKSGEVEIAGATVSDLFEDSKANIEASHKGVAYQRKISFVNSGDFRKMQRDIEKFEKKKQNDR